MYCTRYIRFLYEREITMGHKLYTFKTGMLISIKEFKQTNKSFLLSPIEMIVLKEYSVSIIKKSEIKNKKIKTDMKYKPHVIIILVVPTRQFLTW